MKKLILTVLAALTGLGASAWWDMRNLNPSIISIYETMGRFAINGYDDAVSELTYDCYPTGKKVLSRRLQVNMNEHLNDTADIKAWLGRTITDFDDVLASLPNSKEIKKISSDIDGNVTRAYVRSTPGFISMGDGAVTGLGSTDISEGAILKVCDGNIEMAQTFRVKSDEPLVSDTLPLGENMSEILNELQSEYRNSESRIVDFVAEPRNSGVIRLRDSYANSEEVTKGILWRVSGKKDALVAWETVLNDILAMVGEDYDMSLTYIRDRRLITMQGNRSKTLMAACYKDGTCYVFSGGYFGKQPFLPSNWMHALSVRGNVSYYNNEEVSPDKMKGEELKIKK